MPPGGGSRSLLSFRGADAATGDQPVLVLRNPALARIADVPRGPATSERTPSAGLVRWVMLDALDLGSSTAGSWPESSAHGCPLCRVKTPNIVGTPWPRQIS